MQSRINNPRRAKQLIDFKGLELTDIFIQQIWMV